ncbi:gluconokinase [Chitiniphilus purpureus]|uniref:Gluconokinase n=1 Tax=Chitiniphilus purpureus TaxID=2981137 RepID=A0ABY6DS59_9NEIS|nr:gluconokinase [Chitiniphilus sp. CD1]UXY16862.1 gluconokinase [Chitiniphilus sp. CD1]
MGTTRAAAPTCIVMGVSGSGKSTLGEALATALGARFIDGDDLHPRANVLKMAAGQPLDDTDRAPWLARINDVVFSLARQGRRGVIACSALKRVYRDCIRRDNPRVLFIHLEVTPAQLAARLAARHDHFMDARLLQTQFDALELPGADETDVLRIEADPPPEAVLARVLAAVRGYPGG